MEDIVNPFFSEVAKGIEEVLISNKYTMVLTNSDYDPNREIELAKLLLRNQVDGIIIATLISDFV